MTNAVSEVGGQDAIHLGVEENVEKRLKMCEHPLDWGFRSGLTQKFELSLSRSEESWEGV